MQAERIDGIKTDVRVGLIGCIADDGICKECLSSPMIGQHLCADGIAQCVKGTCLLYMQVKGIDSVKTLVCILQIGGVAEEGVCIE